MRSILFKVFYGLSALFIVSLFTFLLIKTASSNPAENYLRVSKIPITPEAVEKATVTLGLHLSLPEQYINWLLHSLKGDFGMSYLYRVPALSLVLSSFVSTFQLGSAAFFIIVVGSIMLGLISAIHRTTWIDKCIHLFTYINVSMPTFFIGYVLMIIFGVQLKILPVSGKESALSIVLPSITLALPLLAQYTAFIRQHAMEQLESEHVENARIRGVAMRYILKNHVLRNMLPSILSTYCMTFVYLLTGSLIVEEVFAWRGIGQVFVSAIKAVDVPVIQASMLLFAVLFLSINAFTHYLVKKTNPMVRKKESIYASKQL